MKQTSYLIYQTTNLLNGKIYVGKHKTANREDGYVGSGKHLKRAIQKYGLEHFKTEILFELSSEEEMNAKEAEIVTEEFCARKDTYNICVGGMGGFSYINRAGLAVNVNDQKFDREVRLQSQRAGRTAMHADPARKAAWKANRTHIKPPIPTGIGHPHTEVSKEKIRKANKKTRPVVIDGVRYDSVSLAAKILGTRQSVVSRRIYSDNFPNYNFGV